jgi:hypothetical protein
MTSLFNRNVRVGFIFEALLTETGETLRLLRVSAQKIARDYQTFHHRA